VVTWLIFISPNCTGPNHSKNITDEERDTIVKEVVDDQISPSIVGEKYGISTTQIRNWIRVAGHKLPSKYKVTKEKVVKERPK
jgi:transposase-like protein